MPVPEFRVVSAGPVTVLSPSPVPWWHRVISLLTFGAFMSVPAPQPPTIVSAAFTGGPYLTGSGQVMTILATAKSLNLTTVQLSVPLVVADSAASEQATMTVTGELESFNQLAASISDPAHTWKPAAPTFNPDTGDWTCELTAPA
jgi:hypothetical protein